METTNWMKIIKRAKQKLFDCATKTDFFDEYMKIYSALNKRVIEIITASPNTPAEIQRLTSELNAINQFFDVISGQDIFFSLWILDEEGQLLFKDIQYKSGLSMFPVFNKFFDLFFDKKIENINDKLKKLVECENVYEYIESIGIDYNKSHDEVVLQKKIITIKLKSIKY